jgi:hypothetical protein
MGSSLSWNEMTTEDEQAVQMDGTDGLPQCSWAACSRPLDLPLGTSFWSQNRSFSQNPVITHYELSGNKGSEGRDAEKQKQLAFQRNPR